MTAGVATLRTLDVPVARSHADPARAGVVPARAGVVPRHDAVASRLRARTTLHAVPPPGAPAELRAPRVPGPSDRLPDQELPDPMPSCCALVQAAVEAARGARPLGQLVRWVTPQVYEALAQRATLTVRVRGDMSSGIRTTIRRVRLCRLGETVVEATVVVDDGPRVRAVALRMEAHRGSWRGVALEIG